MSQRVSLYIVYMLEPIPRFMTPPGPQCGSSLRHGAARLTTVQGPRLRFRDGTSKGEGKVQRLGFRRRRNGNVEVEVFYLGNGAGAWSHRSADCVCDGEWPV